MDLTNCYSELKASLEALSKENINDLSYLHDRVLVKLQLFIYTYKIGIEDYNKLKVTLSSEIENFEANESIAKDNGKSSLIISGLAVIFILVSLLEMGVSAIIIYLLFFGGIGFLLCLMDISATEQRLDKRKKVIYKMCLEILDKENIDIEMGINYE
ncbi:hypothetical protein EHE19_004315 [Ruminiclostridium herbifermentans]|uniref:Uncharacterized protein n=1 Tax=Ruminiclostridium herbifermentans TaxID=2488810 RepID=A0A4U7JDL0_9FIRM|nr:hypothetical protein [Ruminiclostridium herbifermentans]QNU67699.1 hypothetical protein EHE19_004315 [Ruminiclostridium herbifermentans]